MRGALVFIVLTVVAGCASGEPVSSGDSGVASVGSGTGTGSGSGTRLPPFDPTKPLTLDESVRVAEGATLNRRTFQARLDAARGVAQAAATWANPTVEYHVEDIGIVVDHTRQLLQQEIVSYNVFQFWTKGLEKDVANADLAKTAASIEEDKRQLRLAVGQTFLELLASEEEVRNLTETSAISTKLAEAAATRTKIGEASALDERRARTEALSAQRDLAQATLKREVDGIAFGLALGAEAPTPVTLASDWPLALPSDLAPDGSATVAGLVERALATRPDLHEAEAGILRARSSVDLEDRRAIPLAQWTLSAGAQEAPEGIGGVFDATGPIPVFDWNQGNRARARAELDQALADLERTRRQVSFEIEGALVSWTRSRATLEDFARPIARARDENLEATRRLFAAGEVSYLDLLEAQRDSVAARRELVEAEKDVALARWKLVVAVGR
jgi:cobalt-zinc-cadmium efflux system outer membrane protein